MATETKQATCEDRINEKLADRLQTMRRFLHKYEKAGDVGQWQAQDRLMQREQDRILDVETYRVYKVLYSTGGPHDHFLVHVDEDGEPIRITYHFLDWWDGAERTLTGDDFEDASAYLSSVVYLAEG